MVRALITGIGGFTGQYLAKELEILGYEVCGLVNRNLKVLPWPNYSCDLNNLTELKGLIHKLKPNVVFHLAAISFVSHTNIENIYQTHIVGSRNLLEALSCLNSLDKVLVASSGTVYGNAKTQKVNESIPPSPVNDYGISKLAMEYMAKLWMKDIPITIVRPFNYTGIGQNEQFLIPKIVKHYKEHIPILELGNTDVKRDFSDIRTVVNAYIRLIKSNCIGKTYNVCSGKGYSLSHILGLMEDLSGFQPKIKINHDLIRKSEIKRLVGCNKLLELTIGPMNYIPLNETLKWMLLS